MSVKELSYYRLHSWVRYHYGTPNICNNCEETRRCTWANVTGKYTRDIKNWERLCYSCHRRFDYDKACARGHKRNTSNTYIFPSGKRQCRVCKRVSMKKYRENHVMRLAI